MTSDYNLRINPDDFTTKIDNPYFDLPVGKKLVYEAETPDGLERIEILVPGWTREVMGVETLVFWDRVYLDGELIEDTRDYLAQHKKTGDVWYFGEDVFNYEGGVIADTKGTWLTGRDGPVAMIMPSNPQVGDVCRVENMPNFIFEEITVQSVGVTVHGPKTTLLTAQ